MLMTPGVDVAFGMGMGPPMWRGVSMGTQKSGDLRKGSDDRIEEMWEGA